MRIGGFVKQSLIDWEGRLAAVVFTRGCDFRCQYCHNPSLVLPDRFCTQDDIPEHIVLDYLAQRAAWLDGVVVTGGEPCMQPDLEVFLLKVKALGLPVKLDTNGTSPQKLAVLIEKRLVDAVAMDVKALPVKDRYVAVTRNLTGLQMARVLRSIALIRSCGLEYQFRTTILPGVHTKEELASLRYMFRNDPYVTHPFSADGPDGIVGDWMGA